MLNLQKSTVRNLVRTAVATLAGLGLLNASASPVAGNQAEAGQLRGRMTINAGTVFNLDASGPLPWHHEVRGIVQVSNLGNCKGFFDVFIHDGGSCAGGHLFCLTGKMTITTLAGDRLEADIVGWADPDPNDLKPSGPTMFKLHYDVTLTGGTGSLTGASGGGEINGAFLFQGPDGAGDTDPTDDRFCDSYAGVATWLYDGLLFLPHPQP